MFILDSGLHLDFLAARTGLFGGLQNRIRWFVSAYILVEDVYTACGIGFSLGRAASEHPRRGSDTQPYCEVHLFSPAQGFSHYNMYLYGTISVSIRYKM